MNEGIPPKVLENLAWQLKVFGPDREEVLAQYGDLLDEWEKIWRQRHRSCSGTIHRLWHGLSIHVMEGMREFQAGLAELAGGDAFATRGLEASAQARGGGKTRENQAQELVFIQTGEQCYGRIAVTPVAGEKATIEFSIWDKQNRPIKPFRLTVERGDNKALLNRKEIAGEAYVVKDIEIDDYFFLLESADEKRRVRMGWQAVKA